MLVGLLLLFWVHSTSVDVCFDVFGDADPQHQYDLNNFRAYGDYCYARFQNPDADSRTQNAVDAKKYCYDTFPEGTLAQPKTKGELDVLQSFTDRVTVGILMDGAKFRWAGAGSSGGWGPGIDSSNIEYSLFWYDGKTPQAANAGTTHDFATFNNNSPGDGFKIWHNKDQRLNKLTYDFVCQFDKGSSLNGGVADNGEHEFQGTYDEVKTIANLLETLEDDLLDEVDLQQALMDEAFGTKIAAYQTLLGHLTVYKDAVAKYHVSYDDYVKNMEHLNDELEVIFSIRNLLGDQIGTHQQEIATVDPINESHEGLDCISS